MKKKCIQCGKEFELSDDEIAFFKKKQLSLPKRCKECRQKNKNNGSVQSTGEYHYKGIPDQYHKMKTGRTHNRKRSTSILAGIIVLLILLLVGGNYARQFFYERGNSENQTEQFLGERSDSGKLNESPTDSSSQAAEVQYRFRNDEYLTEHFEKHGGELGYTTKENYLEGANRVIASSESLHKKESEDGDDVYFLESTGELVIVSTDGYIRTYFMPEDGIEYYNKQ